MCYTFDNYIQLCSDNSNFMDELRGKAESFNTMKVLFLYTKQILNTNYEIMPKNQLVPAAEPSSTKCSKWYYLYYAILLLVKICIWLVFLGYLNLPSNQKLHVICCGLYPQFDEILFNKKTIRKFIADNELRAKQETYSYLRCQ